jgi:hypothetical protein
MHYCLTKRDKYVPNDKSPQETKLIFLCIIDWLAQKSMFLEKKCFNCIYGCSYKLFWNTCISETCTYDLKVNILNYRKQKNGQNIKQLRLFLYNIFHLQINTLTDQASWGQGITVPNIVIKLYRNRNSLF